MNTTEIVEKLYVAFFNRPGDVAGVAFWANKIDAGTMSESQIASAFATSAEYQALYQGQGLGDVIANLYRNLFGREAAANELLFWASRLENGDESMGGIALKLANSAQGSDATTIANKISAAKAFTTSVDSLHLSSKYSGYLPNFDARMWLSTITDSTSLATALESSSLVTAVEDVVNNNYGPKAVAFPIVAHTDMPHTLDSVVQLIGVDNPLQV